MQGAVYCTKTSATTEPHTRCNSDNNMANHMNQLDFIVQFIRRVANC